MFDHVKGPALYTVSIILHPGLPSQVSGFGLMRRLDYDTVSEGKEEQQKSIFRFISLDFFLLDKLVKVSETQVKLVDAAVDVAGGEPTAAGTFAFDGEELPSLNNLMLNSKEELGERFPRLGVLNWVLAVSPVGQCLTPTGYYCWYCVLWKYWQFLLLTIGIWTEASYRCFNLPYRVLELVKGDMLGEDYVDAVGTVVAAKAILWQIIPPLSLLSIYSMNTASSPIYTSSIEDFPRLSPNFFVVNVLGATGEEVGGSSSSSSSGSSNNNDNSSSSNSISSSGNSTGSSGSSSGGSSSGSSSICSTSSSTSSSNNNNDNSSFGNSSGISGSSSNNSTIITTIIIIITIYRYYSQCYCYYYYYHHYY